jgi:hypothetical protein
MQEIGDACLRFLADSTDLDTKLDQVQPDTEKAFSGAAEAVEESSERMKFSMREARGEVALLGEEVGVRLPRHVQTFLAQLPGVGPALQDAFKATAVLFVADAIAKVADKASQFIADSLVFTDNMKAQNEEMVSGNLAIAKLNEIRQAAIEKLAELKGATKEFGEAEKEAAEAEYNRTKSIFDAVEQQVNRTRTTWDTVKEGARDFSASILNLIPGVQLLTTEEDEQNRVMAAGNQMRDARIQLEKAKAQIEAQAAEERRQAGIKEQLAENENQKKIALAYTQTEQEKYEIELEFGEKRLSLLQSIGNNEKAAIQAQLAQIEVLQVTHEQKVTAAYINMLQHVEELKSQALDSLKDSVVSNTIAFTPAEQALVRFDTAARNLGITLKQDLVDKLNLAKEAENAFISAGFKQEGAEWKQIEDAITRADKALKQFGHEEDTFKIKSHGAWKEFVTDVKSGATAMDQVKQLGVTAFDDLSKGVQGAFQDVITGTEGFGAALKKATASALASIASQALVKALFYTAEGIAALAGFMYGPAAQYFAAAGEMGAVAALAGVAAHEMSGKDSSSSNHEQAHTSVSDTGTSNRSGGGNAYGVQAFAEGGLITAPTIALAGEAGREAVLPLDNPSVMQQLRDGIGGGDTHHHWQIDGLVSPDNIVKLFKTVNRMVSKGQIHVLASNSLRITKRSI